MVPLRTTDFRGKVRQWANEHRDELMEDWKLCQAKQLPKPIKPLE